MKKIIAVFIAGTMLWGCGSPNNTTEEQAAAGPGRKASQGQMPPMISQKAENYIKDGIEHLQDAEIREAIRSFDNAIRQNPIDPEPYIILSQTYMRLKNYRRAVDTLSAAERIAPNRGDIPYLLAICYGILGDQDMAKASAKRSISLFRESKDEEHFLKAIALLQGLLTANNPSQ